MCFDSASFGAWSEFYCFWWRRIYAFQDTSVCECGGEYDLTCGVYSEHLLFSIVNVRLCVIIEVKACEGEGDSECLDWVNGLIKPEDGDTDDGDTFYEGGDRVSDG